MINGTSICGKRMAVFGLGKSGISAALALRGDGVEVLAWDDNIVSRGRAKDLGLTVSDLSAADWHGIDGLVLAPGVPLHHPSPHPVVLRAQDAGCPIIGDIEILGRVERHAQFIGITGTNGKSTTTSLIGHGLDRAGRRVEVGGNLGRPVLDMDNLGQGGIYVLEMSSYQIDLTPSLEFHVAVLLNITPDHLDRHGGMAGYVAAKKQMFKAQGKTSVAIIGVDTEPSREIFEALKESGGQRVVAISGSSVIVGGVYVQDGILIDDTAHRQTVIMDLAYVKTLQGAHNWQNAAATYAVMDAMGVDAETIASCIADFPGLRHRQEVVGTFNGVLFINDSKATNPDAAARALTSYRAIYWIVGGQLKQGGFDVLLDQLAAVQHAYLVGEGASDIAQIIGDRVSSTLSETIAHATQAAYAQALKDGHDDPVVMLSPACASFDQFENFELRGDHFKACVSSIVKTARGVA